LVVEPGAKAVLGVLAHRSVDDGGHVQGSEVAGEIDRRVHGGQERERTFVGIAVALVIDVVEDEAVDPHRSESLEGHFSDLPGLLWSCRQPRWRHREKQKLTRPVGDAALQVHARNRSPPTNGSTPGGTRVAAIRAQATGPLALQRKRREPSDTTAFDRQLRAIQQSSSATRRSRCSRRSAATADDRLPADASATDSDLRLPASDEKRASRTAPNRASGTPSPPVLEFIPSDSLKKGPPNAGLTFTTMPSAS
jgi:hypothetical protein